MLLAEGAHVWDLAGKFSYPIIHAIRHDQADTRLLAILKQRTDNVEVKRHAVTYMLSTGAFEATAATLSKLHHEIQAEITELGGHPALARLLAELDRQVTEVSHETEKASSAAAPPPPAGVSAAPPPVGRLDTP